MYALLIIIALLLSFIVYVGFKAVFENKQDRKNAFAIKDAVDRVIRRNRLLISDIDILGNKVIGLDLKNNKIILVEHKNNVTWEKCVSLVMVESCMINKEMDQLIRATQRVVMELNLINNEELIYFTFYDNTNDSINELSSRIRKANFWKNKIQHHLNSMKARPKLAYVL